MRYAAKGSEGVFENPSFERQQEVLHSPFDICTHKATFINYLELIIRPDGTPEYATPSHMMKLAAIYGKYLDDIYEECVQSPCGLDGIDYLCHQTGCIAVWEDHIQGIPNDAQTATLLKLNAEGLYKGLPYLSSGFNISVDVSDLTTRLD
jgi:hypothetical protein